MEVSEDSRSSDDQSKPSLNQEDQELFAKQDSDANLKAEVSDLNMDENQCFQSALDTEGLENVDDEDLLGDKKASKGGSGSTGVTSAGRGITLQMLLEDNILQAKDGAMSLEYMGQKFNGDLLPDGKIFSAEVQEVFSSPSAWALRCKKMVNPEQKYGCGWSSVRYCGRPLDVYKNQWMRKRRLEQEVSGNSTPDEYAIVNNISIQEPVVDIKIETESSIVNRKLVKHETLGNRANIEDRNLLVEPISFPEVGKLQPFLVTISSTAFMVMEIHCSLSRSEVVGYLGGLWDLNSNTLTVKQAFPCLSRLGDGKRGQAVVTKIAQEMESLGLSVVGWYHSHPFAPSAPTIQDIDAQLEHQLKLKGTGDQGYRPCIAFIASPFYYHANENENASANSDHMACFWISPPPESRPQEVGRPMAMQYNLYHDSTSVDREFLANVEACLTFYENAPDRISLDQNWTRELSMLDKLKTSLKASVPNADADDVKIFELLDNYIMKKKNLQLPVRLADPIPSPTV